jgi:hypothetical protein
MKLYIHQLETSEREHVKTINNLKEQLDHQERRNYLLEQSKMEILKMRENDYEVLSF